MAAGQRAEIEESDVAGDDGSLEMALVSWTGIHGPVICNKWQSAYFQLIRDWEFKDEKAPVGEDSTARQRRMLEYYDQMQTDMFGSDHRIQAAKRQRSMNAPNQQAGGAITPGLQVALRTEERPENYAVYTPKQLDIELEMQAEEESPDRLLALPEGQQIWDECRAVDSDEESEGREDRQAGMTARLMDLPGATAAAAVFINEVDQLMPYYQQLY